MKKKQIKFIGVITARIGGKRLPGKNIRLCAGKPLIAWTIQEALKSEYLDKVMVTTDSSKYGDISKEHGAEVPFLRPSELATDTATSVQVVEHVIHYYETYKEQFYDYVVLLEPTSPLRKAQDIDRGIEYLLEKKAEAVVSVCDIDKVFSPDYVNTLPPDMSMEDFLPETLKYSINQHPKQYYCINSAIYICKIERLLKEKTFFLRRNIYAFLMNRLSSIDINDEQDFLMAEALLLYDSHRPRAIIRHS